MKQASFIPYGACVEYGRVKEEEGGKYRVESLHRLGVVTPPLPVFSFTAALPDGEGGTYSAGISAVGADPLAAGDKVWFFVTDEGKGLIFARG